MTRPSSPNIQSTLKDERRLTPLALLLALLCSAPPVGAETPSAQDWLQRMTEAAQNLNYDGTFVFRSGDQLESMRIIHRADPQGERSRLVALSGEKREVLRDRTQVVCILPGDQTVVVTKTRPPSLFSSSILTAKEGFSKYYSLSVSGGDRVAGRVTEVLSLSPKDSYRYGYRLWVDRETGFLLKSDLLSPRGLPLEQFIYTRISLPDLIPDELLEPGISGQELTWHISDTSTGDTAQSQEGEPVAWKVAWLPVGFMMADQAESPMPKGGTPVKQMVFTDGLASLSVFVEPLGDHEPLDGLSAMGALNAFGLVLDEHQVTVVGEVPPETVEAVARSVARQ